MITSRASRDHASGDISCIILRAGSRKQQINFPTSENSFTIASVFVEQVAFASEHNELNDSRIPLYLTFIVFLTREQAQNTCD